MLPLFPASPFGFWELDQCEHCGNHNYTGHIYLAPIKINSINFDSELAHAAEPEQLVVSQARIPSYQR